ncbi:MAG: hypothetical protein KGY75_10170 [Candidatus Cloacimonetes bacterium]|nr:hypothetical protein [Candidatus Cloacimonadota bacterium]MBS3768467.1 hypothetical protein [Candidatus Cloacimonadota bacterium]
MKPVIIVTGVPHSFTSMISKFLIDNGAFTKEIWDNPKWDMSYSRFEEKDLQHFVNKRKQFKQYNLKSYFNSLPKDEIVMAKMPLCIYFINELDKYTNRKIKVVYVLRNPEQIILSSMEKSRKSFIYYFQRMSWLYDFMVDCKFELLPFVSERIKKDGDKLISFCELDPPKIIYSSVRKMTQRNPTYLKYRFANFFWKLLSKFFNVFK